MAQTYYLIPRRPVHGLGWLLGATPTGSDLAPSLRRAAFTLSAILIPPVGPSDTTFAPMPPGGDVREASLGKLARHAWVGAPVAEARPKAVDRRLNIALQPAQAHQRGHVRDRPVLDVAGEDEAVRAAQRLHRVEDRQTGPQDEAAAPPSPGLVITTIAVLLVILAALDRPFQASEHEDRGWRLH